MRQFPGTVTTLAASVAIGLVVPASITLGSAGAASAAGPESVVLTGSGWGHGRGLSQYGAKAAAEQGLDAAGILAFYYPGTASGLAGGSVKVLITGDTSSNVVVQHRPRLKVRSLASGRSWKLRKRGAKRWKLTAKGGDTQLSVKTTRWRKVRTIPGQAEFKGKGGTIRLYVPGGAADYRGKIRSVVPAGGQGRDTVNVVSVEKYLRGVVPAEMPATWPSQALRAQAIAARTYAVFERDNNDRGAFDVWDTTRSQVYRGADGEQPGATAAIKATAGQIRTYGGAPAFTQFSSSNGGWTAEGRQPYLKAAPDPFDPRTPWSATVPATAIESAFPRVGDFERLELILDTPTAGHVATVRVVGARDTEEVEGEIFRSRLGLRSTMFSVTT